MKFTPYIYDLNRKAKDHLFDPGIAEPTVRPIGHWWHGHLTSCITSSIGRPLQSVNGDADIRNGVEPVAGTRSAVSRMEKNVLPVQGSPATGKAFVSTRAVLSLVRQGLRVPIVARQSCLIYVKEPPEPTDKFTGNQSFFEGIRCSACVF